MKPGVSVAVLQVLRIANLRGDCQGNTGKPEKRASDREMREGEGRERETVHLPTNRPGGVGNYNSIRGLKVHRPLPSNKLAY